MSLLKLKEHGLAVLLLFVFSSCNHWGFSPEAEKGKRTVKFHIAAGGYDEQAETRAGGARSSSSASPMPEPVSQYLGNGIFVTLSAEEDLSALRDDEPQDLPQDSKFRIVVIRENIGIVDYRDYTVGASDNPPMAYTIPDWEEDSSYGHYAFAAYSYLNGTLPNIREYEDEDGQTREDHTILLSTEEIEHTFNEDIFDGVTFSAPGLPLYYDRQGTDWNGWSKDEGENEGENEDNIPEGGVIASFSFVLRPQWSKATVTLDVSNMTGSRTITAVNGVSLNRIATYCVFAPNTGDIDPWFFHNSGLVTLTWPQSIESGATEVESTELTFLRPDGGQSLVMPAGSITLDEDESFPSQAIEISLPDIFQHTRRLKIRVKFSNCGVDGKAASFTAYRDPSTDDDNFTYRAHVFGEGENARCWMVDNSREGWDYADVEWNGDYDFMYWYQNNEETKVVGPYYKFDLGRMGGPGYGYGPTCPPGWRIPYVTEYNQLKAIINKEAPLTEDEQTLINLWHGNGFVGWRDGNDDNGTWKDQGSNSAWRYWYSNTETSGNVDIQPPEDVAEGSLLPLRCVRSRKLYTDNY